MDPAVVDRRFNRHRYDATRTIEAFSRRLRDEVELDTLSAELPDRENSRMVLRTGSQSRVAARLLRAMARAARVHRGELLERTRPFGFGRFVGQGRRRAVPC